MRRLPHSTLRSSMFTHIPQLFSISYTPPSLPVATLAVRAAHEQEQAHSEIPLTNTKSRFAKPFLFLTLAAATTYAVDSEIRKAEEKQKKEQYESAFDCDIHTPYDLIPFGLAVKKALLSEFNSDIRGWIDQIDPNTLLNKDMTISDLMNHLSEKGVVRFKILSMDRYDGAVKLEALDGHPDLNTQIAALYAREPDSKDPDYRPGSRSYTYHILQKALENGLVKPDTRCSDIIRPESRLYSARFTHLLVHSGAYHPVASK